MASLAALRAPLLAWCKAQRRRRRRVTAVVSDMFTGWTQPLAADLGVPHVTFSASGAHYLAVSHSLWRRLPRRRCPDEAVSFQDVPGSPTFRWSHLSWLYRTYVAGDEVSEAIRQFFLWNLESSCFVANSFTAIEAAYVDRPLPDLMEKKVFAVGPLSDAVGRCTDRGGKPAVAPARVAAWLDAFDDGSVLYVCFGRSRRCRRRRRRAWPARWGGARRRSSGRRGRHAGAGRVRGGDGGARYGHPRVGAAGGDPAPPRRGWFLTHCGWNSVLEAVAAGVAMLAWPMSADQFTNAWLLAEAGVAVAVAEGADAVPDAGQMADAIASAIGNGGASVRQRAAELGRSTAAAVAEGGSSSVDLEELVSILSSPKLTN